MKHLRLSLAALLLTAATVRADTFFVAASGNNTIERVTANGTRLNTFAASKLTAPTAIVVDGSGNLYVCDDQANSTIEKFASDGRDLGVFASANLHRTYGLAFDSKGNLYAANYSGSTIEKFSSTGTDLGTFVSTGLSGPVGLVFDGSGNLYVANASANSIGVYSSAGTLVKTLTSSGLVGPYGMAFDANGNLYVCSYDTSTVRRFSSTGTDLGDFVPAGILSAPLGLTFDASGNLYVTNESAHTISRFSSAGASLGTFATLSGDSAPAGIARLVSTNAGTLQFILSAANTTETSGSVALLVRRLGGNTGAVSVKYATANGTALPNTGAALAGTDYTATSGTVSWIDGDTADKTFTIPILNAGRSGGSVYFDLTLSSPTGGAVLGSPITAKVVIADNDPAPQPTILITSPPNGFHVVSGQSVSFAAKVTDPGGQLADVKFLVNNSPVYDTTGSGPYVQEVPTTGLATGTYTVEAIVTDKQGRTSTNTITVTIDAPNPNAAAPTATVLTPLGGLNLKSGSTVAISFSAAVADGTTLAHIDLYANEQLIGKFNSDGSAYQSNAVTGGRPVRKDASPVQSNILQTSYTLPVQATSELINVIAVAFDALGQSSVSSVASFQNTVTEDNAPKVAFSNLSGTVEVPVGMGEQANVNASDPDATASAAAAALVAAGSAGGPVRQDASSDAVIAELSYFLNGVNLQKPSFVPPYGVNFSVPAPGKYTLHAVATDGAGLSTVSDPVVLDAVQPPTVTIEVAGDGHAVEGGENGKLNVRRTGGTSTALTVSYKVKGSAVKGVDYTALSGTVTIPVGSAKAKIKVKPIDNTTVDSSVRKVKVRLLPSATGSYTVGDPAGAKISVIDND